MTTEATATEDEDEILATLSDFLDGTLPAAQRASVEAKLASDERWQATHAELSETREALSGLQKARAPSTFSEDVTATIYKRSAGRFFGKKTFGDRVPFGAILIVALIGLGIIAYVLSRSPTGSLKVEGERAPTKPPAGLLDTP